MPSAVMRATVSLGPPAGNGTIMTMLRLGNCCACTNATVSSNSATSAVGAVILFILFSLDYPLLLSSAARAVRFLLRRRRRKVGNAYADRIIYLAPSLARQRPLPLGAMGSGSSILIELTRGTSSADGRKYLTKPHVLVRP